MGCAQNLNAHGEKKKAFPDGQVLARKVFLKGARETGE